MRRRMRTRGRKLLQRTLHMLVTRFSFSLLYHQLLNPHTLKGHEPHDLA